MSTVQESTTTELAPGIHVPLIGLAQATDTTRHRKNHKWRTP